MVKAILVLLLGPFVGVLAEKGFEDPRNGGGSMLASLLSETYPPGQKEPLNGIISSTSDPDVLVDRDSYGGLRNYFYSLLFSGNCLDDNGITAMQQADLGDGLGPRNQTEVMRYNYNDVEGGSCTEVVRGGNHFRYWTQNGFEANTGAIFIAISYEYPLDKHHDIVPNGYNLGRDYIVGNISGVEIPTLDLSPKGAFYSGTTSYGGYTYNTSITYVPNLLSNSSIGINHNETVGIAGVTNAVDGLVAVFEVTIVQRPYTREDGRSSQCYVDTFE